jgi:transcriptional regulator with XRE-family HTH domain
MKVNQRYFASRLGISESYLSRILNAKSQPTWQLAKKLSNMYVLSPDFFLDMDSAPIVLQRNEFLIRLLKRLDMDPEILLSAVERKATLPDDLCRKIANLTGCDYTLWAGVPAHQAMDKMGDRKIENYNI